MDRFDALLQEIGNLINVPLHPDKNRACRLHINNSLHVQIEDDAAKDRIVIASFFCDLPPGKFRENILKEALKTNDVFPRIGILAFSERTNKLALFDYLPFVNLTGVKVTDFLSVFIEKANAWKKAVETGSPLPTPVSPSVPKGSIFSPKT